MIFRTQLGIGCNSCRRKERMRNLPPHEYAPRKAKGMTKEALRRLYVDERLTDAEIGRMYNASEGCVTHMRRQWDIKPGMRGPGFKRVPDDKMIISLAVITYNMPVEKLRRFVRRKARD